MAAMSERKVHLAKKFEDQDHHIICRAVCVDAYDWQTTTDPTKVTCKRCLTVLAKEGERDA